MEGEKEEGEGVERRSKDSCSAGLYLLRRTVWTAAPLCFHKSNEVSPTLERIR